MPTINTGLILVACPHCDGEGAESYLAGPGYSAPFSGSYLPYEHIAPCDYCEGRGDVEVCACCLVPLEIVRGEEMCSCVAAEMRHAA